MSGDGLPPRVDLSHVPEDLRALASGLIRGEDDTKYYLIHSALMVAAREIERITYERDRIQAQAVERIGRLEKLLKHLERWFESHNPEKVAPRWKGGWQHRLRDIHQALASH